jgi:mannose-6-phosphate isomerase-like protein (cupin superfamily)
MAYIKNWRDVQPKISHMSAVHWGGLRTQERQDDEDDRNRLIRLGGFARHALQGRKTSDHHKHEKLEQVYYVLGGRGEVLFDGTRYPVEDGDAIYLPSGIYHQMFNDQDTWLEHHVISMNVESNGGDCIISNWRHVPPQGDGAGAVRWHQLGRQDEADVGCLKGMHFIAREAVQPRSRSIDRVYNETEQVYYILENKGVLVADDLEQEMVEGDMVHIPVGMEYHIKNPHEQWFSYMIMAA